MAFKNYIYYRIYDLERGLLVRPMDSGYGYMKNRYPDFETMEEAAAQAAKDQLILPVVVSRWSSDES